jgi:hypothetical protein
MKPQTITTDTFNITKHELTVYRISEAGSGVLLWTNEQQAIDYITKIRIRRLAVEKKAK